MTTTQRLEAEEREERRRERNHARVTAKLRQALDTLTEAEDLVMSSEGIATTAEFQAILAAAIALEKVLGEREIR